VVEAVTGDAAESPGWSAWRPLALSPAPDEAVLSEILDGGQAFRWRRQDGGFWTGQWSTHLARVRASASGGLEWSAPARLADKTGPALSDYLDCGRDSALLADSLPWRSDAHLAKCMAAFPGLRLLRQPLGETLLGFLCSSAKRIVQIKQMIGLVASRHGRPIEGMPGGARRLPTWPELARLNEADLRGCLLGFRARHVHATARFLAERPGWLERAAALPYPESRMALAELPGVGDKVADCVLLYGAGELQAFPADVWIIKAMARHYGLAGWKPSAVAQFGRAHFGPLAGLAQQYLFAYERRRS
jgi:N-glycosylase/DNA lyase